MRQSVIRGLASLDGHTRRRPRGEVIVFLHGYALVLLLVAGVMFILYLPDAEALIYPTSVLSVAVYLWCFWSWKQVKDSWCDPYTLFLLSIILFNGGEAVLEALNLSPEGVLSGRFSAETTESVLLWALVGISAMHFGALVSATSRLGIGTDDAGGDPQSERAIVRWVGWSLLAISILPTGMLLWDFVSIVMSSGYSALYQQESRTGLMAGPRILAGFFVPALVFLIAGGRDSRISSAVSSGLVLGYALVGLFIGGRYGAGAAVIAFLWVLHRCVRPIPGKLVAGMGALVLLVVLPTIAVVRNLPGGERMSAGVAVDAYLSMDNSPVAILSEMGGTLRTVAETVELVPGTRPFEYGMGYVNALLTVFPNILWDVHPAVAQGTPTDWLVRTVDPYIAAAGGSLGYSVVAEAYLNFGFPGIPIVMCVIGFLYSVFVRWGLRGMSPARVAAVGSFLSFVLVYARSDATSIVRPLFWYTLLPYAMYLALRYWRGRIR